MKLQFKDIIIEADSLAEVKELLALVPASATVRTVSTITTTSGIVESRANRDKFFELTGKRFRLTKEEEAAGLDSETAAHDRLIELGHEPIPLIGQKPLIDPADLPSEEESEFV